MAQEEVSKGLSLESITVDETGRVIVTDPQLADRLRSAEASHRWWWGGSNTGCNHVRDCGNGQNVVAGCGAPVTK